MPQWIIDNSLYFILAGAAAAGGLVSFLYACKIGAIRNNKHVRKALLEIIGGSIVGFVASQMISQGQLAIAFGAGLAWSAVANLIRKKTTAIIQAAFFGPTSTRRRKNADENEENGD